MVWRVVAENDPREKDLHVGVTRGTSPGEVTTIVAAWGKLSPLAEASCEKYFILSILFYFYSIPFPLISRNITVQSSLGQMTASLPSTTTG